MLELRGGVANLLKGGRSAGARGRAAIGMSVAMSMLFTIPAALTMPALVHAQAASSCTALTSIRTELGAVASTATIEEAEGAIFFGISQTQCADDELIAALESMLSDPSYNRVQQQAIQNVIERLRKRKVARGTGAIGQGVDSSFTSPGIGGGGIGGASNYSTN